MKPVLISSSKIMYTYTHQCNVVAIQKLLEAPNFQKDMQTVRVMIRTHQRSVLPREVFKQASSAHELFPTSVSQCQ